jgi:hypothetical protein
VGIVVRTGEERVSRGGAENDGEGNWVHRGLKVQRQVPVPIPYKDIPIFGDDEMNIVIC